MKFLKIVMIAACPLLSCSTGPSPSNCYGNGQPGCEAYWKDGKPRLVTVEPNIDKVLEREKITDKKRYLSRWEAIGTNHWTKASASELDIRKALLECNVNPYWNKNALNLMRSASSVNYYNGLVLIQKCMVKEGFEYVGALDLCAQTEYVLPACLSNAFVPTRDVKHRINGSYCIEQPITYECQPQPFERRRDTAQCRKYPEKKLCKPEVVEDPTEPDKQLPPKAPANPYAFPSDYPDQPTQLQQQMQFDSRHDMNQMLKNTTPVHRR